MRRGRDTRSLNLLWGILEQEEQWTRPCSRRSCATENYTADTDSGMGRRAELVSDLTVRIAAMEALAE